MSRRADNRASRRHEEWMRRAIAAAAGTSPHPNPRVGAVVVSSAGAVAAVAAHQGPGTPHAEALALQIAGRAARRGTVVVSLEPCDHHGRTPPCTEAIVAAGVSRVVVATEDPDDRVSGSGLARLRAAGIDVVTGVLADEAKSIDEAYHHHRLTGLPRFTLKFAMTLDGQVAAVDGSSRWITSEQARADAHAVRAASDAVVVGAGTLRVDDPVLTARLDPQPDNQPAAVLVAGLSELPAERRLWERSPLVYSPRSHDEIPTAVEQVVLWHPDGVDLQAMAKDLAARGRLAVLVEGGPTLAGSFLACGLVDEILAYVAGSIAGGAGRPPFDGVFRAVADARTFEIVDVRSIGPDLRIRALPGGR